MSVFFYENSLPNASRLTKKYKRSSYTQSDICHQSVYELVHSEDREDLQRHLMWNSHLPNDRSNLSLQEALLPGKNEVGATHDQDVFRLRISVAKFGSNRNKMKTADVHFY